METPNELIDCKVIKKSLKPFKSTFRINTVKGIVINEQDPKRRLAFTFYEDESVVGIDLCVRYLDSSMTAKPIGKAPENETGETKG